MPKQKLTGLHTRAAFSSKIVSSSRRTKLPLAQWLLAPLTVLLATLLTACGTNPPSPSTPPEYPTKPALQTPLPSEAYLTRVQRNTEKWEQQLKDTRTTLKP
jgi:outer membrane PBP1 activator LpoA protein